MPRFGRSDTETVNFLWTGKVLKWERGDERACRTSSCSASFVVVRLPSSTAGGMPHASSRPRPSYSAADGRSGNDSRVREVSCHLQLVSGAA